LPPAAPSAPATTSAGATGGSVDLAAPLAPMAPERDALAVSGGGADSSTAASNLAGAGGGEAVQLPKASDGRLYVYKGVGDLIAAADGSLSYRVPSDAFAHTDATAVVRLEATLANGAPLPGWLRFDPFTREFSGTAPTPEAAIIEVRLVARDDAGREATVVFNPIVTAAVASAPGQLEQILMKSLPEGAQARQTTALEQKLIAEGGPLFSTGEPIGFPVVRVPVSEVPASMRDATFGSQQRLFVYQGISGERLEADGSGLRIPRDAFAHTDPSAIVLLEARLADGRPLPEWLSFDRIRGTFTGEPPRGLEGDLEIEVIARDTEGHEARTTFHFSIESIKAAGDLHGPSDQRTELGVDVDAKEIEKARLEAARLAQQRAVEGRGAGAKAVTGKPLPAGAAGFSEQLRGVKAARDPLLDRVTKTRG